MKLNPQKRKALYIDIAHGCGIGKVWTGLQLFEASDSGQDSSLPPPSSEYFQVAHYPYFPPPNPDPKQAENDKFSYMLSLAEAVG